MDHTCVCLNGTPVDLAQLTKKQWYKRPGHFNGTFVRIDHFLFNFYYFDIATDIATIYLKLPFCSQLINFINNFFKELAYIYYVKCF